MNQPNISNNLEGIGSIYLHLQALEKIIRETDDAADRARLEPRRAGYKRQIRLELDQIERKAPGWLKSVEDSVQLSIGP